MASKRIRIGVRAEIDADEVMSMLDVSVKSGAVRKFREFWDAKDQIVDVSCGHAMRTLVILSTGLCFLSEIPIAELVADWRKALG